MQSERKVGYRAHRSRLLTRRERAVAELAARGRTNHEIADELHLSVKAVEWNLTKIYRNFGLRSRTELAVRFARGELGE
jgi:DNA-binding NarL/FixJ family response regulator